ncbi:hypothetical protein GLAREA_12883 [Glarea lozoyensis ATCC 20868]|uniref:Uncharacterized protein n=1 Tax=Glarea lozoyensis (strain ATCC 20868 / MF5171) TaxID=1116229 RepID=S3CWZ1_GLAL2|nr:uncharacterized protein GLAREA_12883 [Glarea lozoyensis ATCC 20868]EPE30160.1 hypothetical protein GLAREA_12883 [Glarea lozoyensis ATCC 20868]
MAGKTSTTDIPSPGRDLARNSTSSVFTSAQSTTEPVQATQTKSKVAKRYTSTIEIQIPVYRHSKMPSNFQNNALMRARLPPKPPPAKDQSQDKDSDSSGQYSTTPSEVPGNTRVNFRIPAKNQVSETAGQSTEISKGLNNILKENLLNENLKRNHMGEMRGIARLEKNPFATINTRTPPQNTTPAEKPSASAVESEDPTKSLDANAVFKFKQDMTLSNIRESLSMNAQEWLSFVRSIRSLRRNKDNSHWPSNGLLWMIEATRFCFPQETHGLSIEWRCAAFMYIRSQERLLKDLDGTETQGPQSMPSTRSNSGINITEAVPERSEGMDVGDKIVLGDAKTKYPRSATAIKANAGSNTTEAVPAHSGDRDVVDLIVLNNTEARKPQSTTATKANLGSNTTKHVSAKPGDMETIDKIMKDMSLSKIQQSLGIEDSNWSLFVSEVRKRLAALSTLNSRLKELQALVKEFQVRGMFFPKALSNDWLCAAFRFIASQGTVEISSEENKKREYTKTVASKVADVTLASESSTITLSASKQLQVQTESTRKSARPLQLDEADLEWLLEIRLKDSRRMKDILQYPLAQNPRANDPEEYHARHEKYLAIALERNSKANQIPTPIIPAIDAEALDVSTDIWNNTTTRAIDDEPEDNIMVDEQVVRQPLKFSELEATGESGSRASIATNSLSAGSVEKAITSGDPNLITIDDDSHKNRTEQQPQIQVLPQKGYFSKTNTTFTGKKVPARLPSSLVQDASDDSGFSDSDFDSDDESITAEPMIAEMTLPTLSTATRNGTKVRQRYEPSAVGDHNFAEIPQSKARIQRKATGQAKISEELKATLLPRSISQSGVSSKVSAQKEPTQSDRQSPKTLKEMIAARTKTRNPLSISPNPDETWEVEEVIEKASTTLTEYLVKWKGREGQEWVTARHFSNPEYARQELERLGAEAFDEGEGVGIEESRMTGKSRKHDEAMRRAREQMVRDMVDLTKDSEELVRNREELAKDRKKLIKDKEAFVERVERFEERLEDEMDGVRYGRVSESESPPVKRRRGRPRKKGDGEVSYLDR